MKAAVVQSAGQAPVYAEFPDPDPASGQDRIRVRAAAISQLARARASGKHYSAAATYPFVAGVDGAGVLDNGQRVYFAFPEAPYGAFAELVPMRPDQYVPIPDAVDDVTAAAIVNPGISGWMALKERAAFQPGETVLINGATGSSGSFAVQIARRFGAGRIIATGRNAEVLRELKSRGVDETISLAAGDAEQAAAFEATFARGIDIVLDYLWGPPARQILAASARCSDPARALRFVQIGAMAGAEISLPAAWLRSRANVLMGSGLGSVAPDRIMASMRDLLISAGDEPYRLDVETAALTDITDVWGRDSGNRRVVLTP
ncbi:zinc-binding alcohol dehydrogenase family protein [Corticibacterium sp. UT-5YL-CI-8]|nr:zinc-binding alcohol dehydrogenase family protein [Tianweitania sp. UT-5YL-CI-8]